LFNLHSAVTTSGEDITLKCSSGGSAFRIDVLLTATKVTSIG
jgi:hypothetical protein